MLPRQPWGGQASLDRPCGRAVDDATPCRAGGPIAAAAGGRGGRDVAPHLETLDVALERLARVDRQTDAEAFRTRCVLARLHHLTVAGQPQAFDQVANGRRLVDAEIDLPSTRSDQPAFRTRAEIVRLEDDRVSIVAFNDRVDVIAWASARRALDYLRGLDIVVFPILPATMAAGSARRGSDSVLDPLAHAHWLAPAPDDTRRLLDEAARVSGGEVVAARASARLLETFAEVLGRYRQRYVLSFEPAGVATGDGWHRLEVRVPGHRAKVTARGGYRAGTR